MRAEFRICMREATNYQTNKNSINGIKVKFQGESPQLEFLILLELKEWRSITSNFLITLK